MKPNFRLQLEYKTDDNGEPLEEKELVLRDVTNNRFLASWNVVHEKLPTTHYIVRQALLMAYEMGLRDRSLAIRELIG